MSLNGLDDLKIKEAHDAAVAEPGGWFLLKYASRDEIELSGRGNGGIVEIRNAIAQFEEPSPLFGFLRYRRRNVVIKYVPEECSRLVQARVTVHFNAVTERFSPHDTVFPITTAKELRDTTLSAACSLHTASGSTSSSTSSLRRRRLMEIAEDAEEEIRAKRQSTVPEERPPTAKTTTSLSGVQVSLPESTLQPDLPNGLPPSASFNSTVSEAGSSTSPVKDPQGYDTRPYSPTERRKSSQSTRPDLYTLSSYGSNGRPKVKLGPRPSLDVGGRPHTSGAASYYRPVSTLPAGLKLSSKGSKKEKDRTKSDHNPEPPTMTISPPPMQDSMLSPTQVVHTRPHTSGGRPSTGSESLSSPTSLTSPTTSTGPRQPIITPEKARLMKAMQLRNKKIMEAVKPAEPTSEQPDALVSPASLDDTMSNGAPKDADETLSTLDMLAKADDSGIAFDASSTLRTDESDATRSDSYPVSPVGPSEKAESSKASSISESTDETVHNTIKDPILEDLHAEDELEEANDDSEDITPTANSSTITTSLGPAEEQLEQLSPTVYNPLETWTKTLKAATPATGKEVMEERPAAEAQPIQQTPEPATQVSEVVAMASSTPEIEVSSSLSSPKEQSHDRDQNAVSESVPEEYQEPLSPSAMMRIPTSRFNVQEPEVESDIVNQDLPAPIYDAEITPPEKSPIGSTFSTGDESQDVQSSKRQRRKGLVEPIRTDLDAVNRSRSNSEAHFSSDDDLMDELSSAVMQEAQPISVSKSPVSPVFPSPKKRQERQEQSRFSRVFSAPLRKEKPDTLEPPSLERPPSRSVSAGAAYLNRINQQPSQPLAKKVNLGSGISQRIKALEKLQSLAPGATPTGTTGPPPGSSPAFFSVRKGSVRGKSPSIAERANSLTRNSPSDTPESSPETIKPRDRSGSVKSRLDTFISGGLPISLPAQSRPESVSVTARIIRDPSQPFPSKPEHGKDPSEYAPLYLKQSPLVIDLQKAIVQPPKETIQERRLSKERRLSTSSQATNTNEKRSSITIIRDLISDRRSSFSERRRSVTIETAAPSPSGRSSSRPPSVHASPAQQRPMSMSSRVSTSSRDLAHSLSPPPTAGSSSSTGDEKADKKSNRASRMLRRMSSGLSASRKTIAHAISPTVREESEPLNNSDTQSMISSYPSNNSISSNTVDIGDVNVQFPDSLLWKRRSMLLDSQGFLIISPALSAHGNGRDKANAGATRRFHLSEFRTPSIPDVEMQELPNSVVLDFTEGGGLQVACEDRAGQGRILDILQDAHQTWAAYGQ